MMKQLAWWERGGQQNVACPDVIILATPSPVTTSDKIKYGLDKWTENSSEGGDQKHKVQLEASY